jgi:sec-independent protein translocase protein TatB
MFEIGFPELMLIAVVGLLVIGPERLPEALRTLGLWFGRMRRSFTAVKAEIEKEIGMDEVRRQLHNEAVMEEMKRIESEVRGTVDDAQASLNEGIQAADNSIAPPPAPLDTPADAATETSAEAPAEAPAATTGQPQSEDKAHNG